MKRLKDILSVMDDLKIESIEVYDVRKTSPMWDYVFIGTVKTKKQIGSFIEKLKKAEISFSHVEGEDSEWMLVDCGDSIINIMTKSERDKYALDDLYAHDSKILEDLRK